MPCYTFFTKRLSPLLVVIGCIQGQVGPLQAKVTVVVTTSIIGDTVKNIVQDDTEVIVLMGAGVDPHTYKPTLKDIKHLLKADIIFYNGLHLEGKMAEMLRRLSDRRRVYAVGSILTTTQKLTDPNFSMGVDPHIWFDIHLWQKIVTFIKEKLVEIDSLNATFYKKNTQRYLTRLAHLHRETWRKLQQVPPRQRVLITAHDAFGYFGRAYQIEVRGLQGISTVSECGLSDITTLVRFIIERNIKAIFLETSVPEKPLKAVIEGCKKRGHCVKIGGYLYSDALGKEGTLEGSYYGMIQRNTQKIVNALK